MNQKYKILIINIFILFGVLGVAKAGLAATYYVDGSATNDSGTGSTTSPKKYITSGLRLMSGGDTLIIKDGVYTGVNNMIGDYASPQINPPSGTAQAYTTIKAEHVGGAVIDAEYLRYAFSTQNVNPVNYVIVQGIHFRHGQCGLFNIMGDHNKVLQSGFEDGEAPSHDGECPIAFIAGGSSYSLVEDSWVWGKGRYGFYTGSTAGGTNHIIFRRVVVRLDATPIGWVTAGLRFYNGQTNAMQNSIVIDSLVSSGSVEPSAITSGGGSSTYEPDHLYEGMMVINNPDRRGYIPEDGATTNTFTNSVLWGNKDGIFAVSAFSSPFTLNLSNLTIGENIAYAVRDNANYSGLTTNLTNSLIQVPNGGTAFNEPNSITITDVYIPGTGTLGSNPGGYTSINGSTYAAGLKYLPRIESGSTIANAGIGPSILYQIGVSGSVYGDSGWNTVTTTSLWPWPDQDIWTSKLKAYIASGPGGNRGFAAGGTGLYGGPITLTSYIWEYLGNICPIEICIDSGSILIPSPTPTTDTTSPAAPTGLTVN